MRAPERLMSNLPRASASYNSSSPTLAMGTLSTAPETLTASTAMSPKPAQKNCADAGRIPVKLELPTACHTLMRRLWESQAKQTIAVQKFQFYNRSSDSIPR